MPDQPEQLKQPPKEEAMDVDAVVDAGLKDIRREVEGAVQKEGETAVEGAEATPPTPAETALASDAPPAEVVPVPAEVNPVPAEVPIQTEVKVADTTPAAETADPADPAATTPADVADTTVTSDAPPVNGVTPAKASDSD